MEKDEDEIISLDDDDLDQLKGGHDIMAEGELKKTWIKVCYYKKRD